MRRFARYGWLATAFALAACPSNVAVPVGGGCSADDVCLTGFCIRDTDANGKATHWAAGYCSGDCASNPSCPQSSCLKMAEGSKLCVATCAADGDCRAGYVCDQHVAACLPDCRKGWSCGSTLICNSNGSCELPAGTTPVGGACSADNDCADGFCIRETDASGDSTGWAGGYCSGDCASSPDCPQGECLAMAEGSKLCVATCAEDGDCRSDYVCDQAVSHCLPDCRKGWACGSTLKCNSNNGNCQLPKGTVEIGGDCLSDNDCANAYCIRDTDASGKATGWAGGYCSGDCGSDPNCPQGRCLKMADSNSYCVAGCATDPDCRSGYVCAKAALACLPDCRKGWSCGSTFTCNQDNGSCQAGFAPPGP